MAIDRLVNRFRVTVRQRRPSRSWSSTVAGIGLLTDTLPGTARP